MVIQANIIDLHQRRIFHGKVSVENGRITSVRETPGSSGQYLLPGFVDAHVHIESSMLIPSEFARLAVVHGTVATVSDPHEIANVLGKDGVYYMIENGSRVPFKFNFGAPSCVPATSFETAGAAIDVDGVTELLQHPEIRYLAEMMNYPGVLFGDEQVHGKIAAAHRLGKPVDGHAPGLRGDEARRYIDAGISTDHECFTYEEALDKLNLGMKVLIREGSAAKNFDALIDLLPQFPDRIMFCSDDKHPDDLIEGHINQLVSRALARGHDLFEVLRAACVNPVEHYGLPVGLLREGDPADFILTGDLTGFRVKATYIDGRQVAADGRTLIDRVEAEVVNRFSTSLKEKKDFRLPADSQKMQIIEAIDGSLITGSFEAEVRQEDGFALADPERDILKIAVVNRYADAPPAVAFIRNFGLWGGAIASCVGHDSHNIIAVAADDASLCRAVNLIIENQGGISAVYENAEMELPLPVAGIMTHADGYDVARAYQSIDTFVKNQMGSQLRAPFMTLSFMALLVIPDLKLSDRGLFSGKTFQFVNLFV